MHLGNEVAKADDTLFKLQPFLDVELMRSVQGRNQRKFSGRQKSLLATIMTSSTHSQP